MKTATARTARPRMAGELIASGCGYRDAIV